MYVEERPLYVNYVRAVSSKNCCRLVHTCEMTRCMLAAAGLHSTDRKVDDKGYPACSQTNQTMTCPQKPGASAEQEGDLTNTSRNRPHRRSSDHRLKGGRPLAAAPLASDNHNSLCGAQVTDCHRCSTVLAPSVVSHFRLMRHCDASKRTAVPKHNHRASCCYMRMWQAWAHAQTIAMHQLYPAATHKRAHQPC